jgi:hypothetical protein
MSFYGLGVGSSTIVGGVLVSTGVTGLTFDGLTLSRTGNSGSLIEVVAPASAGGYYDFLYDLTIVNCILKAGTDDMQAMKGNGRIGGALTLFANQFNSIKGGVVIDNQDTSLAPLIKLKTVSMRKNVFNSIEGSVKMMGKVSAPIETCDFL